MLLGKLRADDEAGSIQLAAVVQAVPLFGEVNGDLQIGELVLGHRNKGLGKHSDHMVLCRHLCHNFRGFALPFNGNICGGIQTVFLQQIVQRILRGGAFSGGVNGLAAEALPIGDGLAAFLHDVNDS